MRAQVKISAEQWHTTLVSLQEENLRRWLSEEPQWRAMLQDERLQALSAEDRKALLATLLPALLSLLWSRCCSGPPTALDRHCPCPGASGAWGGMMGRQASPSCEASGRGMAWSASAHFLASSSLSSSQRDARSASKTGSGTGSTTTNKRLISE